MNSILRPLGVVFFALLLSFIHNCRQKPDSNPPEADDGYDRVSLLKHLGNNVIVPLYADFASKAQAFNAAATAYCSALSANDPATTEKTALDDAWKAAMRSWQRTEVLQVGPVAMNAYTYRQDVYSWPSINSCGVDREVANASGNASYALTADDNRKGLYGVEYLLFDADLKHSCPDGTTETVGWNEKTEALRRADRCHYIKIVATDIKATADKIVSEWQNGYVQELEAGIDGSTRESVNAITDAFFYLDKELKDMKLATPAGISDVCAKDSCPDLVEHSYSNVSKEAIIANLEGFYAAFTGIPADSASDGSGLLGFDDYLKALGREDVATKMVTATQAALTNLKALPSEKTLSELATAVDPAQCAATTSTDRKVEICAIHADLRAITDILKSDFLSVLDLEAPARAEGDND